MRAEVMRIIDAHREQAAEMREEIKVALDRAEAAFERGEQAESEHAAAVARAEQAEREVDRLRGIIQAHADLVASERNARRASTSRAEAAEKALGRFGEALVSAGLPSGDRDQQEENLRALIARAEQAELRVAELEAGHAEAVSARIAAREARLVAAGFDPAETMRAAISRAERAESQRDAAVEAHSVLLSRIAADGTLDAMERASAAEQRASAAEARVKRLEVELAGVCGAAESLLSPDSSAVDIERLRERVGEARAASESEVSHG